MLTKLILTRDDCLYNRLVPARTRSLRTRIVNEHVCGWPTAGEQPHGRGGPHLARKPHRFRRIRTCARGRI